MKNKETTKGLLKEDLIIIEVDFLEHLLNCMANQKFINSHDCTESWKSKEQKAIDKAYHEGRQILSSINNKKEKEIT